MCYQRLDVMNECSITR